MSFKYSRDLCGTKLILKKSIALQDSNQDSVFLICGEEGTGKSNTILNILSLWEYYTNKAIDITHVCRNITEALLFIKKHNPSKTIIALDEGYEIKSDNRFDKAVKIFERVVMGGRYKGNIYLLASTNPFKVNSYFRDDRIKGVFFCVKHLPINSFSYKYYVLYFKRSVLKSIKENQSKNSIHINNMDTLFSNKIYRTMASFIEVDIPINDSHLSLDYDARKDDAYAKLIDNIDVFETDDEVYMSIGQVATFLRLSKLTIVNKYVGELGSKFPLQRVWNLSKTISRFKKSDVVKFKDDYLSGKYDNTCVNVDDSNINDDSIV